jgi:hypothetical protein
MIFQFEVQIEIDKNKWSTDEWLNEQMKEWMNATHKK